MSVRSNLKFNYPLRRSVDTWSQSLNSLKSLSPALAARGSAISKCGWLTWWRISSAGGFSGVKMLLSPGPRSHWASLGSYKRRAPRGPRFEDFLCQAWLSWSREQLEGLKYTSQLVWECLVTPREQLQRIMNEKTFGAALLVLLA